MVRVMAKVMAGVWASLARALEDRLRLLDRYRQ